MKQKAEANTEGGGKMKDRYEELRQEGKSQIETCQALMSELGMTVEQAAQICWAAETGKPMPVFEHDRKATATWDGGFEKKTSSEEV